MRLPPEKADSGRDRYLDRSRGDEVCHFGEDCGVEAVPLPSAFTPSSCAFSNDAMVSMWSRGMPRSTASWTYSGPKRSMKASMACGAAFCRRSARPAP